MEIDQRFPEYFKDQTHCGAL